MRRTLHQLTLSSGPKDRVSKGRRWTLVLPYAALCAALSTSGNVSAEPLKLRISWATAPSQITPLLPEVPPAVYRHWGKSYVVEPAFMQGNGVILPALQA